MKVVTSWVFGGVLAGVLIAGHASAQGQSRRDVRLDILDRCVLTQSGPGVDEGAGPMCNCYAPKIAKLLTDEEVARFRRDVPKRLADDAKKIMSGCR